MFKVDCGITSIRFLQFQKKEGRCMPAIICKCGRKCESELEFKIHMILLRPVTVIQPERLAPATLESYRKNMEIFLEQHGLSNKENK